MDTSKNVVIIMDVSRFTKQEVVDDIKAEGYPYNFFFANFNDVKPTKHAIEHADEVWTWGDCTGLKPYEYAKELRLDLWNMKR